MKKLVTMLCITSFLTLSAQERERRRSFKRPLLPTIKEGSPYNHSSLARQKSIINFFTGLSKAEIEQIKKQQAAYDAAHLNTDSSSE